MKRGINESFAAYKARRAVANRNAKQRPFRILWHSPSQGTAICTKDGYAHKPVVAKKSGARKLTEAEDNALARATRRRQNRRYGQAGIPHAAR